MFEQRLLLLTYPMRLFLAGLTSVGIIFLVTYNLTERLEGKVPDAVMIVMVPFTFIFAITISWLLFNRREERGPSLSLASMEARGLVVATEFHARRAFEVEEFEDEGVHYYLELDDGATLYLTGQYLYEYEAIEDDPKWNQPRKFPNAHFVVKRHLTQGDALEILPLGPVLEPEVLAPCFSRDDYRAGVVPEDGDLIRDRTYDEIKRQRLNAQHL